MLRIFKNAINRHVDERINQVIDAHSDFHFIKIDDANAEKMITDFIVEQKGKNNMELSIPDFVLNLHLPASQVDGVMKKFESKNLVKEVQYA